MAFDPSNPFASQFYGGVLGYDTISGGDGRTYTYDESTGVYSANAATDPAVQEQLDLQQKAIDDFIKEQQENVPMPSDFNAQTAMQDIAASTGFDATAYANQLVGDPAAFFNQDMRLADQAPVIGTETPGTTIDPNDPRFAMDAGALAQGTVTAQAAQAAPVTAQPTETYEAATSFEDITRPENQMVAAQGQVREEAIIQPPQADMQGLATGVNADGTISYAGQALGQFANQNITNVIDTSTMSGKLLADSLGQFNYTDAKATVQGQMDLLSKEFVDPVTGETKIPTWAAGTARAVSRIAAFKGMTGSAATATMAQAIMEASLPIAQADAQFFQTLTIKNLDNKQQQIINTANVLSKMELANLDARMASAVENSKNFMQMDLANLDNQQQARVINTQARVQSILEDAKAVNTARLFAAESINEQNRFYDNLNASISTFNTGQRNSMAEFNAGQINSMSQFNAQLENQREVFYKEMQYNIDIANTKWRQSVTLQNAQMQFEAAATDVKNMVGVSVEQLNQLWDRSDALLDYAWRSSETAVERANQLKITKMQAEANMAMTDKQAAAQRSAANSSAMGSVVGSVVGASIMAF